MISQTLILHTQCPLVSRNWLQFSQRKWVRNLLSSKFNYQPFLQHIPLQLSTPWPWGIVRSCHGGRTNDKVQTTILTNIRISANIRCLRRATHCTLPAACLPWITTHYMPSGSHLPVPGVCNSASLWIEHAGAYMEACSQVRLRVSSTWSVYLGA